MRIRLVDAALILATLAGGYMAVSSARKLHGFQRQYNRLSQTTGDIDITDPTQLHVQAIQTDEPLHFAWRVYAPAGQLLRSELTGGHGRSSGSDHNSQPHHFIARIRFTEQRSDQTTIYSSFGSGSSFWTAGSAELFQFLREHWNEVEVEQLGASGLARLKPDQPGTLLRLHLPDDLAEEARLRITDPTSRQMIPSVFECRIELKP